MCWRMLLNGCLQDAHAAAESSVLRAQTLRVYHPLLPLQKCHIQAWLQYAGTTSMVIGHAIYGGDRDSSISHPVLQSPPHRVDPSHDPSSPKHVLLGEGYCVVVFLDKARRPSPVSHRDRLNLLVPAQHPTRQARRPKGGEKTRHGELQRPLAPLRHSSQRSQIPLVPSPEGRSMTGVPTGIGIQVHKMSGHIPPNAW